MEMIQLFAVLIALPFGLGWASEKFLRFSKGLLPMVVAVLAAGFPTCWIFFESQQADSITRAAAIYVVPIVFCVALIPAAFGCSLAMPNEDSK
jgi:hypothetical protein